MALLFFFHIRFVEIPIYLSADREKVPAICLRRANGDVYHEHPVIAICSLARLQPSGLVRA